MSNFLPIVIIFRQITSSVCLKYTIYTICLLTTTFMYFTYLQKYVFLNFSFLRRLVVHLPSCQCICYTFHGHLPHIIANSGYPYLTYLGLCNTVLVYSYGTFLALIFHSNQNTNNVYCLGQFVIFIVISSSYLFC